MFRRPAPHRVAATLLLALSTVWAAAASAQEGPAPAEPAAAASSAGALLEVLRDDAARAALIADLERLVAEAAPDAPQAAGDAPPAADAQPAEDARPAADARPAESPSPPGFGRRLAETTQALAEDLAQAAKSFANGLAATQRRLAALYGARGGALFDALLSTAAVAAAAIAINLAARALGRRMSDHLVGDEAAPGPLRVAGAVAGRMAVDLAAVVLAWGAGYAIALAALGDGGRIDLAESLFLNAFLIVETARIAMRALLSPGEPRLRPLPLSEAGARAWGWRVSILASALGYGLLFLAPLVDETVSIFTGRAVSVVIQAIVTLWIIALVIRHRNAPALWVDGRAEARDATHATLRLIARFWHWPVLAWLVALFVSAVSRSGAVGPLLTGAGEAVAIAVAALVAGALLGRAARRGVSLPERVARDLPMLEGRLNGFLRRLLSTIRFAILVLATAAVLDRTGVADFEGWATAVFGPDFGGRLLAAAVVVTLSFAAWLAMASWTDWRLNSERRQASAREQTLFALLRNALTVVIAVLGGMIALSELGLDIGPLLASAGVLGLAIGFGAQRLVQDVITGVFIQLENAINVGDVVTAGGTTGVAEKLTIRSVALRDLHGVFHVIPFSSVDMVSNFMRGFAFHVADLGIAYREQIEDGRTAMERAFEDLRADPAFGPDVIGSLEWFGVNELGDSAVVLRARIRTLPGKQWAIGRAYNERLKKRCDEMGVEIPFPHLTVWFGQGKDGSAPPIRLAGEPKAAG